MSALASLAAYGGDDDEPEVEQSQPAKEGDASSSCAAGEPTPGANGAQPAPASSNPPPPDMSDTAPPPAARPFAGPSSPIAPSRTPSSRTSSLAHLLPPPPLAHTETNPAIEVRASPLIYADGCIGQDTDFLWRIGTGTLCISTASLLQTIQQS